MRQFLPIMVLVVSVCYTQELTGQLWTEMDGQGIVGAGQRDIVPQTFRAYQTDWQAIHEILWSAPLEYHENVETSGALLTVPLADGTADIFRMVRYDMMEAYLAARFTHIKTFKGVSISNPYRTIRADWTEEGFRAVIHDEEGLIFIDPYQRGDMSMRIVYYKKDFSTNAAWECGVITEDLQNEDVQSQRSVGDCIFRSYRLAVATTGEYSNYFDAFSPDDAGLVLSQVVTAINRVNEVYEADFAVRMILIGNTDDVFYYDAGGDPFSGSACNHLNQNQTNMTTVIGNANYDIGHVFSVGSGGCAGLGVLCSSSGKARGATGLNPPTGDPFYIDYVAHEIGHQFGGDHTFNGTAGSCNGNRVGSSAYEPGSGSTIQAYAGICGAQNVQANSDAYFHGRSLRQMTDVIQAVSCHQVISFTNQAPVATALPNYTIPVSTPFVLTAVASDPEGDPLTYCWEQYDLEGTSTEPPAANDADGPLFRSLTPTVSPSRYFPKLESLVNNTNTTWEVLPSVSRPMNFKMTVRDYHSIAGCTDEDDVVVTSTSTSGPFVVTSQNSTTTWLEASNQVITWNVANTTSAPVSCASVDLFLSLDGGYTYPTTLALNEPNDGSATVSIPAGTTTMGRVMVKGSNNIFFDINNVNITINPGLPNFTLELNPVSVSECNDGEVETTVMVGQFMNFMNPVTLSILNLPPGAVATFNPPVVIPGNSSTLTIQNLNGLFGTYTPTVRGTSTTGNKDRAFQITLLSPPATGPTLSSPANNATDVVMTPTLDWQMLSGITQYEYQVAYDNAFTQIAASGFVGPDIIQLANPLTPDETYFWRVRGNNTCGAGTWSTAFSFTTNSCFALMSTNVPVNIPASGTPTVTSVFQSSIDMVIDDINVINLSGAHSWVDDLKFTLISPDGTERLIWNQPCGNHDNFSIQFDDEATNSNWPCPPTNGLTYRPDNTLSIFDGEEALGTWTLRIQDVVDQDGGSLSTWGLKVCGELGCQLVVNQAFGSGIGSLPAAINCAMPGDTVYLSAQLSGQTIDVGASTIVLNKDIAILALGSNTRISTTGNRLFEVMAGMDVSMSGFTMVAGKSLTGGAIVNNGVLTLEGITVDPNPIAVGGTLIQSVPGATLTVLGNCTLTQ